MNNSQRLNSIYYTLLTTLLELCFLILPQDYFIHFSLTEQLQAAAIFLKKKTKPKQQQKPKKLAQDRKVAVYPGNEESPT